jgi:hypothetical protein
LRLPNQVSERNQFRIHSLIHVPMISPSLFLCAVAV